MTTRRRVDLARAERADRDLAVDAAEVEPGAMPRGRLHRRRRAPVGAHDERVAAGAQSRAAPRRAGTPRCGAPTRRPSRKTRRAVVDGLEADRVVGVGGHLDRGPVGRDAALEAPLARGAADHARVRRVGQPHAPRGTPGPHRPRPVERDPAGRPARGDRRVDDRVRRRHAARTRAESEGRDEDREDGRDERMPPRHQSWRRKLHTAREASDMRLIASQRSAAPQGCGAGNADFSDVHRDVLRLEVLVRCPRGRPRGRSPTA